MNERYILVLRLGILQNWRHRPADIEAAELTDWLKGFCAAMADYDLDGEHSSIQAALLHYGIDGDLLEECLKAAEAILDENEFHRWPSVPLRGFGAI